MHHHRLQTILARPGIITGCRKYWEDLVIITGRRQYVTCSHEMMIKSHHAVPSIGLKTVVGVNLGEIEIFALHRSSFTFTPYAHFYHSRPINALNSVNARDTVNSILRNDSDMAHFYRMFAFHNPCRTPCITYQNKGHDLKMWAIDMVV